MVSKSDIPEDTKRFLLLTKNVLDSSLTTTNRIDSVNLQSLNPFNIKADPIPTLVPGRLFSDCADLRGIELLKRSETDQLVFSWSGGIDSTVAVTSLLKNGFDRTKHKIKIALTVQSISEYRFFFERHIALNFEYVPYNEVLYSQFPVITGELGDQLFGSDILLKVSYNLGEDLCQSADIKNVIISALGPKSGPIVEHYLPIAQYCPIPVETVHDFLWWWNFTQKWNNVKYRLLNFVAGAKPENLISFYDTTEFQQWSLDTPTRIKMPAGILSYKKPAKDYVISFTKDESYKDKLKVGSLYRVLEKINIAVLDSGFVKSEYENFVNPSFLL